MQKTAQERGMFTKLKEWSNVSGRAAEAFFNPQFKEIMEHIRKKDDQIRSFVVGKKLGDAEIEPTGPALKDILKQAKSNINRREFMSATHDLGVFHERVKNIVVEIGTINSKVDDVHSEFLYKELTPEQKEHLIGFKKRFAQQQKDLLIKEAGIGDFLHNLGKRGRGLAAWEKRYPKKVKEIRNALGSLLGKSEGLLSTIISALKDMAAARADRNIDNYMVGTVKITNSFNGYEKSFKEFYKVISQYIDELEKFNINETNKLAPDFGQKPEAAKENAPAAQLLGTNIPAASPAAAAPPSATTNIGGVGSPPHAPPSVTVDMTKQISEDKAAENLANLTDPQSRFKTMPAPPPDMEQGRHSTIIPPPPKLPTIGMTHKKFYSSLESLSSESPAMLALFIKKYANSIRVTDPNTSSKLFKIAQQIKG